jgi:hypothetical protein
MPIGHDVLGYVRALFETACAPETREISQVQRMKKYMNYLGLGAEPTGQFLHQIRRVSTKSDFFRVCEDYLSHERAMPMEPFRLELGPADVLAGEHC